MSDPDTPRALVAQQIRQVVFTPVRLREGYDMGEVDALLDQLAAAAASGAALGPLIDQARFTPVRLREGYDMGEVDEFLARLAATDPGMPAAATAARPGPPELPEARLVQERRGLLSRLFGRS